MSTEIKYRLLLAALLVCVLGLAAQAIYLWRLDQRYAQLAGTETASEPLTPIEEKILESLDEPAPGSFPTFDPFALGGPKALDPFGSMQSMQQRMDALLESVFGQSPLGSQPGLFASPGFFQQGGLTGFSVSSPDIRISETDQEYQILVTVPESHEVELNTEIEGNTLSISGKIQQQLAQQGAGTASSFVSRSQFSRQFPLSHEVDEFGIATEQTPTGLMVRVPKKTG